MVNPENCTREWNVVDECVSVKRPAYSQLRKSTHVTNYPYRLKIAHSTIQALRYLLLILLKLLCMLTSIEFCMSHQIYKTKTVLFIIKLFIITYRYNYC